MDRHVLMLVQPGDGQDRRVLVPVAAISIWLRPTTFGAGLNLLFWLRPALCGAGRGHFWLLREWRDRAAELSVIRGDTRVPWHGVRQVQGKARPDPAVRATLIARRPHDEVEKC